MAPPTPRGPFMDKACHCPGQVWRVFTNSTSYLGAILISLLAPREAPSSNDRPRKVGDRELFLRCDTFVACWSLCPLDGGQRGMYPPCYK